MHQSVRNFASPSFPRDAASDPNNQIEVDNYPNRESFLTFSNVDALMSIPKLPSGHDSVRLAVHVGREYSHVCPKPAQSG
jgi:hypothetical protein